MRHKLKKYSEMKQLNWKNLNVEDDSSRCANQTFLISAAGQIRFQ